MFHKMKQINREVLVRRIGVALRRSRMVALLGPRQCGKSTLARRVYDVRGGEWFDLERPSAANMLKNAEPVLEPLRGLVVIDEVQRQPELFPLLRVLADRPACPARFLLLGSASPTMIRNASESLAGRLELIDMSGFSLAEIGVEHADRLWLRGGFPLSYLARNDEASVRWREDFITLFLERDLANLGLRLSSPVLRRFWMMIAHSHGQVWNASEIGGSLGVSYMTAKHYLDVLSQAYVIRQVQPLHENIAKRQVKMPKVYVRDSGLLHALLGIRNMRALREHPKVGLSWEGRVVEEVIAVFGERNTFFWATHGGAELDLLAMRGVARYGFECKCSMTPDITRSMRMAQKELGLRELFVVHPGPRSYAMDKGIRALSIADLPDALLQLFA
jgi:predicted AAA+ superfamily ATPase